MSNAWIKRDFRHAANIELVELTRLIRIRDPRLGFTSNCTIEFLISRELKKERELHVKGIKK